MSRLSQVSKHLQTICYETSRGGLYGLTTGCITSKMIEITSNQGTSYKDPRTKPDCYSKYNMEFCKIEFKERGETIMIEHNSIPQLGLMAGSLAGFAYGVGKVFCDTMGIATKPTVTLKALSPPETMAFSAIIGYVGSTLVHLINDRNYWPTVSSSELRTSCTQDDGNVDVSTTTEAFAVSFAIAGAGIGILTSIFNDVLDVLHEHRA